MFKVSHWKNTASNIKHEKRATKNKTDKKWERNWNNVFLGCNDYTHNFKPQEVKMSLEKNQTVLFVDLANQDF